MVDSRTEILMRVAAYIRVSTIVQNAELQIREISEYVARQGWPTPTVYQDVMSGARATLPSLSQLLEDCRQRKPQKVDCVCVWKLDRFGRSLVHCLTNLQELDSRGVRFVSVTQGIDTDQDNPAARFLLHILGAAAEFERSLILERSKAGFKRYQQDYEAGKVGKGVQSRSGKNLPPHRPRKIFDREKVWELSRQGKSTREIAREMGISQATVIRALKGPWVLPSPKKVIHKHPPESGPKTDS